MAKGKKIKEEPKKVDSEEEEAMDVEEETKSKKESKKSATKAAKVSKKHSSDESEDSEAEEAVVVKKPAFALLMDDSDDDQDDSDDDKSEEEKVTVSKKPEKPKGAKDKNKKKKDNDVEMSEAKVEEEEKPDKNAGKGGKKGKKKKKKDDDEEDIEKVLAELELEYSGKKAPPTVDEVVQKEEAEKDQKKSKKKKGNKAEEAEAEAVNEDVEVIDGIEVGGTVKTAAQKRKEKKERQKQKQQKTKKEEPKEEESKPKEETPEPAKEEETEDKEPKEDDQEEDGDKKGKKKKKKGEKEDDKKKAKKPGKSTLLAMQEALKKVQEEQEKARLAEEERIRKEEEAEKARLEKKRQEEERKALKKQKEKEKKEQLRKEGKLLTAKQKAEKAKAEAMLEAMRAQGLEVPQVGEKRAPRPGTRIRKPKKQEEPQKAQEEETKEEQVEVKKEEAVEESKAEEVKEEEPKEEIVESWEEVAEEVKDSWDADEEEAEQEGKSQVESESRTTTSKDDDTEEETDDEEEESEEESDEESDEESEEDQNEIRREKAIARIQQRKDENEKKRSTDKLRSPVVCVLGHVDTGKTKILDKLRRTHVQDGEAGGITQQIGATNVPIEVIQEQCKMVKNFSCEKLPGLLIIDTPGHESFSNLRDRGSSLCDIAILVVDIMHSLEPQTIESINLLKKKKTPFVIALNKIDRLYEWKPNRHKDIQDVIESQQHNTKLEFQKRAKEVIIAMAEQGLNASLFYENPDPKTYISMVPTSAHSGDGMGNLMGLLVELSQNMLAKRLAFSEELQATVLEVKAIQGLGTTIDIVLVNGSLKEGQTFIVAGTDGPIVTQIKALLTPAKMQDLRVKNNYIEHKEIKGAIGVKICGKDLEKAIAGLNCLVAYHPDEVEICKEEIARRLEESLNAIKLKDRGVFVQASTLGSLEALLEFLRTSKIPYAGVKIGPVVKRDVMKASVMLEHEEKYTVILAFDVKVERDAQELADSLGVKIFQADIIYHLFDRFMAYQEDLKKQKREEFKHLAVFPCKLRMLPNFIFNSRDPIVAGVIVEAGIVRQGTPLCVPSKDFLEIGICTSIQNNHKEVETARKGEEVCVKIEPIPGESPKMFGRHFDEKDIIVSKISRQTIDVCKEHFRDDLQKSDWQLMVELKKVFQIL